MQKNPAEIGRFQPDLVGVSGFEPEASWSRRLVGYFSRTFRAISAPFQSENFTAASFPARIIPPDFRRLGHGLGQNRKSATQKLRRCKQRIAPDFCRFPGRSARSSARCPSGSVFASDSRHRSGRCARHSRCATQNCRSATSGKAVDVGSVASSVKREQIAVQEIAPVGVVDLSV